MIGIHDGKDRRSQRFKDKTKKLLVLLMTVPMVTVMITAQAVMTMLVMTFIMSRQLRGSSGSDW